ncbi:SIMPL domain-containing protein [Tepidibacter formicigenes]|jgi:uncharacterized protein YggE|uniref:SIMPL domain-containing protein n=1 Tax=Tepidibacter formicigenes DSM 15518 TaxID=1123349 RepID=A0A1M6MXC9_9FIRM|nr:SIMPL domain-containing protein [Tepidibacter formicigenes]SHJ88074.1 hypothetical protein SAMN02744037_01091 [Tepidibacter formicigenes DSM 15518]
MIPYMTPYKNKFNNYRNEEKNNKNKGIISVNGIGIIKTQPDTATLTIGVVTEDKDLKKAQRENSLKVNQIIKSLAGIGIKEKDIQTINYTVRKNYDYIDGKQEFRNYEVRHILQVTVRDINQAGNVYDIAVENGANIEGGIEFSISSAEKYYNQALELAVENAIDKANKVANTLETNVKKLPSSIKETTFSQGKAEYLTTYMAKDSQTPILGGLIEIKAQVTAVFEMI